MAAKKPRSSGKSKRSATPSPTSKTTPRSRAATKKKTAATTKEAAADAVATAVDAAAAEHHTWRVIYVHGIGNKPPAATLKRLWDHSLFGRDMGSRTRMAYWADLRYAQPLSGGEVEGLAAGTSDAFIPATDEELLDEMRRGVHAATSSGLIPDVRRKAAYEYASALTRRMLAAREQVQSVPKGGAFAATGVEVKVLPIPSWARRWLTERITRMLIRDTAAYFFDAEQRREMQERLRQLLVPGGGPYVVVAHSQGSIIAYDVLRQLAGTAGIRVPLLVTVGSPLGLQEVQDQLAKPLRAPSLVEAWSNFADLLDPVALDKGLGGEYAAPPRIADALVVNKDSLRIRGFNPHSGTGYLATSRVQEKVRESLPTDFTTPLEEFVVAKDVAREMAEVRERLPVLIEIRDEPQSKSARAGSEPTLDAKRKSLVSELRALVGRVDPDEVAIDALRHYVAARLTASEIEVVSARHEDLRVARVWKNSRKRALIVKSAHVVQAYTARVGYLANGKDVGWAVLDTGVRRDHPHFAAHDNIAAVWDCHRRGAPAANRDPAGNDRNGHGTHVAGIIAGEGRAPHAEYRGMAPQARLHVYKVLDDEGGGEDAWIIKALDHIAALNENSPTLVIHGVNLSLGGPFDVEVFGCGHSPLCRELRRLWRQGVAVCIAAGNEGRTMVATPDGVQEISLDLSIGDPANLDEAVAVGSVHRDHPHLYGVSYFSSRGPTADGRPKPDLVAPGEKIVSCNAGFTARPETHYVAMSGTSMACPHVSGLLAAFLSVRREFLGHPDRVKELLLSHCTDLGRDRYHQGAGMPNLVKMLMDS